MWYITQVSEGTQLAAIITPTPYRRYAGLWYDIGGYVGCVGSFSFSQQLNQILGIVDVNHNNYGTGYKQTHRI